MQKGNNNPVALVTGASSPLGASICENLVRLGYDIAIHYYKNKSSAELLQNTLQEKNPTACFSIFQANLAKLSEVKKLRAEFDQKFSRLDLLINNAGIYRRVKANKMLNDGDDLWFEGLDTTVTASFFTTSCFVKILRQSPNARIINIGDSACHRPSAKKFALSYHIGKTGVYILTKSFAQSEAPHGVTVNMISPGLLHNTVGKPKKKPVPMKRYGEFSDVNRAIDFLIDEKSSYITGTNIIVSGGWNL